MKMSHPSPLKWRRKLTLGGGGGGGGNSEDAAFVFDDNKSQSQVELNLINGEAQQQQQKFVEKKIAARATLQQIKFLFLTSMHGM